MPFSEAFQPVAYPITGGSYESRSRPLSQQRTLNMYAELAQGTKEDVPLMSWGGLKSFSTGATSDNDRGIYKRLFNGLAYQVAGSTLYSINSVGVKVSIGTINGGDQVTFADNGFILVIVGGNTAYSYDGTTLSVVTFTFTPATVDYLNNQFIYGGTDGNVYITTAGTNNVFAGNSFPPDSSPDKLVRPYVFDQFLFNFSEGTIEPWENTGGAIPPFTRMTGGIAENTGLAGAHAVSNTSAAIYFLGADNEPYTMLNFQARKIGTAAVSNAFQGYDGNVSCKCQYLTFENQDFILFIFPVPAKVWAYSEQTGLWLELDHDVNGQRYLGNSIGSLFNKNLVCDYSTGNIYELDLDTFTDNGVAKVRERTLRPLSGEQFGNARQRLQLKEFKFSLETGVGNPSDPNPLLMTSLALDGEDFGNEVWHELGREGEIQQDIRHSTNASITDVTVKIRYTGNTRFALYTSTAWVRQSGR